MVNCLSLTVEYQRPWNQCSLTFPGRHYQFPLITHTLWAIITDLLQGQKKKSKKLCFCSFLPFLFLLILWNIFLPLISYFNPLYCLLSSFFHFYTSLNLIFIVSCLFVHIRRHSDRQCFGGNTGLTVKSCVVLLTNRLRLHSLQPLQHTIKISPIWLTAPVLHPPIQSSSLSSRDLCSSLFSNSDCRQQVLSKLLSLKSVLSQYWTICMN